MKATISIDSGNRLKVTSSYSPILVERFRAVPGARAHYGSDGKFGHWSFPIMPDTVKMVADVCGIVPQMLPPDVRDVVSALLPTAKPREPLDIEGTVNGHEFLTVPYAHQKENLARTLSEDRWLFADQQGTGKTHAICNRIKTLSNSLVLILCPKSVIPGWAEQLREHADIECAVQVDGSKAQKRRILKESLQDGATIFIAGYETVLSMADDFLAVAWNAIVIDECQKVKNFTAKVSKLVQQLSGRAGMCWALSGTPAPNGLEDWLGVLSAVKPGHLPVDTKTGFEARYCFKARIGADGPWKIAGYRNVEELHGLVQAITSRVTKAEALDLPPKVVSTRYAELDGEQARVYRELKKDAVVRLQALKDESLLTASNILTEQLRLLQIVGGFVKDDLGVIHEIADKCKLDALREVIDEVGDRQVVVWCCFVEEIGFLADWLEDHYGGGVSMLTGQTADRQGEIEAFASGERRWFIGSAGAGGTGVNGLQVCDTEIYYSRNFRLDYWLQSQDRCHRIGSRGEKVSVIKLVCQNTVDMRVDARLDEKDSMQTMMLQDVGEML